jgi:hypothetical protein
LNYYYYVPCTLPVERQSREYCSTCTCSQYYSTKYNRTTLSTSMGGTDLKRTPVTGTQDQRIIPNVPVQVWYQVQVRTQLYGCHNIVGLHEAKTSVLVAVQFG